MRNSNDLFFITKINFDFIIEQVQVDLSNQEGDWNDHDHGDAVAIAVKEVVFLANIALKGNISGAVADDKGKKGAAIFVAMMQEIKTDAQRKRNRTDGAFWVQRT